MLRMVTPSSSSRTAGRTNNDHTTAMMKTTHAANNGSGCSAHCQAMETRSTRPVTPHTAANPSGERWRISCCLVEILLLIHVLALWPISRHASRSQRDRPLRSDAARLLSIGRETPNVSAPPATARTRTATSDARTATSNARELLGVAALSNASLTRWLHGLPGVDRVGADSRAAGLGTRSIKTTSKAWAIDTAISMIDLTTLEGADTEGKVRSMCAKAMAPDPGD